MLVSVPDKMVMVTRPVTGGGQGAVPGAVVQLVAHAVSIATVSVMDLIRRILLTCPPRAG
jgi:hypothetical protein